MTPWDELTARCQITCPAGGWRPATIAATVEALLAEGGAPVERESLGESFEGRPIDLLTVGAGPKRVLLWSQMHGDEPTHTTVLLNLLKLLGSSEGTAETLLAGLTLGLITPLNPDGAQRYTRHNAQGIDVNRDALAFATHEGRALREALGRFRPDYGFNLHNQEHRIAVGTPPEPVAASLLVPPIDPDDTQNDNTREATRVAATFCESLRPHCGGRLSRYEVDYLARAFGEWCQRQGVATLLIEASGWPGGDFVEPERVHFAALVQTLEAIAAEALGHAGGLSEADPSSYLDLPRSSPYRMHDLLVSPAGVVQSTGGEARCTPAEVGVDYPDRKAGIPERSGGRITAIGDLHENGGIDTFQAPGAWLLPGRIVLAEPSVNAFEPEAADWDSLAAAGATTALVPVDLSAPGLPKLLESMTAETPPINAALVGRWGSPPTHDGAFYEPLLMAIGRGLVALIGPLPSAALGLACERLGLPVLDPAETPTESGPLPSSIEAWLAECGAVAGRLGWTSRGAIGLKTAADFVLVEQSDGPLSPGAIGPVFVGGAQAFGPRGAGQRTAGRWLKRPG